MTAIDPNTVRFSYRDKVNSVLHTEDGYTLRYNRAQKVWYAFYGDEDLQIGGTIDDGRHNIALDRFHRSGKSVADGTPGPQGVWG